MSAAFGSGNTVGVGPNTTTKIIHVLLKIALPLLAVAYLLLDVEFFASLSTKGGPLREEDRDTSCAMWEFPNSSCSPTLGSTGCRAHVSSELVGKHHGWSVVFAHHDREKSEKRASTGVVEREEREGRREEIVPMLRGAMAKIERIEEEGLSKGGRKRKKTRVPLYVWATAGMRILTDKEQIELWRSVASVVAKIIA